MVSDRTYDILNEALGEAGLKLIQDAELVEDILQRLAIVITKLRAKQQASFTISTVYGDLPVITAPSVPEGTVVYRYNEPPEFLEPPPQPRKRHPLYD